MIYLGEVNKKRGRPKKKGSMQNQYRLMMSDDMADRLANLSKITGMSRANIFREAFDGYEKLKLIQSKIEESEEEYDDFYDDFD